MIVVSKRRGKGETVVRFHRCKNEGIGHAFGARRILKLHYALRGRDVLFGVQVLMDSRAAKLSWAVKSARIGVTVINPFRFNAASVWAAVGICWSAPWIHKYRRPWGDTCGVVEKLVSLRIP